jgi:U3 small nucleolar RNA-associated protein 20
LPVIALRAYIYSHFYSLTRIDEISIRSASSNCLRLLIELFKRVSTFRHYSTDESTNWDLLENDVIHLMQYSIKSSNENIRHEVVNLLAILIDNFGDELEILQPLKQLRNTSYPDICFFENVTHLQIHRRQRAFNRLATGLESHEVYKF